MMVTQQHGRGGADQSEQAAGGPGGDDRRVPGQTGQAPRDGAEKEQPRHSGRRWNSSRVRPKTYMA